MRETDVKPAPPGGEEVDAEADHDVDTDGGADADTAADADGAGDADTSADADTAADAGAPKVVVVGGGVAGLTAGIFTARAGMDTVVLDHGESILRRNSHLENMPGFPAGVNSRLFLDLLAEQARRSGCLFEQGLVTNLQTLGDGAGEDTLEGVEDDESGGTGGGEETDTSGFQLRVEADEEYDLRADYVIVASWSDTDYLERIDGVGLTRRGSKTFVDVDDFGRTGCDGLYAAGRIAEKPHQTVVCAGHGAEVALTLVDDSPVPFYHDWVAPEGYFTERGHDVPPGVEEIDEEERRRRERESMEVMREAFAEPHPDQPTMHPSVVEKRRDGE